MFWVRVARGRGARFPGQGLKTPLSPFRPPARPPTNARRPPDPHRKTAPGSAGVAIAAIMSTAACAAAALGADTQTSPLSSISTAAPVASAMPLTVLPPCRRRWFGFDGGGVVFGARAGRGLSLLGAQLQKKAAADADSPHTRARRAQKNADADANTRNKQSPRPPKTTEKRAHRPDDGADLVAVDAHKRDDRSVRRQRAPRRRRAALHLLQDARAPLAGLRERGGEDVQRDALDFDVHLERGHAAAAAGDFKVHVAERVLAAEDVGQHDEGAARLEHEAHRDAGDGLLERDAWFVECLLSFC